MDKNYKILNRDQIKYLAIVLMTFNHIAHILMTPWDSSIWKCLKIWVFYFNYHVLFSGGRLFLYTFKEIMQSVCFFLL